MFEGESRSSTVLAEGKVFNSKKGWQITAELYPSGQMRIYNSGNGSSPSLGREAQIELLKLLMKLHPLDALSQV